MVVRTRSGCSHVLSMGGTLKTRQKAYNHIHSTPLVVEGCAQYMDGDYRASAFKCPHFIPFCTIHEFLHMRAHPRLHLEKVASSYGCELSTGGTSPRFWYVTPPPPPPPCPPGPLSCQGSTATGHTYGGAEGARNFFFSFPLPILSTLHPNTILEPNLDSNAHPNPQPTPNPTHKPYP